MANTLLTSTQVTRKALMILHQKLNFIGSINRGYDDSFAKDGAKIGDTLKIRLPNQYPVRTGTQISANPDTTENTVSLQVGTQKGVDVNFSSNELTLSLDDFSDRVLEPAMSALAANIESDAMSMYKDVYQQVSNATFKIDFNKVLQGRKKLVDSLAPLNDRTCNLNTQDNLDLVDALKGLFQDSPSISKQYREGYMGRTAGFDFMENTLWPSQARGDAASYVCNTSTGITSGTATITVSGGSGTFKKGDVFTVAGVNAVHPESKVDTGQLQQFVATADSTTSIAVSPTPISAAGATQNIVINSPGASKAVTVAGNVSTSYGISMAYQKGAFAFATADLVLPRGVDFAAREVLDGISMRIVRQYDIVNDKFPCRIDVLYGYKTIRPQLACRLANN
ncbi:MAG TPA: P22 phage major capsid protein family protein [Rhizomicrobium sp.]|nr:P22 phage major capsid protein family protein [Rhizomicrobium sp.]